MNKKIIQYGLTALVGVSSNFLSNETLYAQAHRAPLTKPHFLHNTSSAPTEKREDSSREDGWELNEKIAVGATAAGIAAIFTYAIIKAGKEKREQS
jgi:hypothetical protein